MARRILTAACALLLSFGVVADDENWIFMTFRTAPFQPPRMEVTKTGDTDPGYLFVGPRGNQQAGTAALIYDEDGNLVYQGPEEVTANFKVQRLFHEDVITFWSGNMMDLGYGYGTVHILDNTYREIYTVTLQPENFVTPDGSVQDSFIDLHESHITDRNTLLVTAYNVTQHGLTSIGGTPDDWMLDALFYEIDIATNEIVHSWSALEQIDDIPLDQSKQVLGEEYGTHELPWDAYHINSVELLDEGYIVSLRHYWSGFYVHNNGSVMWQFSGEPGSGDFELDPAGVFSWQHDIRIYNRTEEGMVLNLFNNANTPTEEVAPTTGLSFAVDLVNRKATPLRILDDPNDVTHSVSQGSYQLLSPVTSHVVLGYGSISKVKEFDANNNAVLTARFGSDNTVASYRGFKCPWKAYPFWKPELVIDRIAESVALIFMSWNGATEHDNWAVYSVSSPDSTASTFITSVQRTGFETTLMVSGLTTPYLHVVARKGDIPLGTSEVVTF